jgi:ZIP family zinc transporter
MGINTAAAIAIHNFPEGLATFVATLAEPSVGVTLAIAIGIHNIPEGLCVALPIYYATDSRLKGFLWALLSGISEPVGALIGYAIIKSTGDDMSQVVYGVLFGLVAGMMIMIVILELLPTAYRYDPTDTCVTNSVVVGMLVMAASLCLFLA